MGTKLVRDNIRDVLGYVGCDQERFRPVRDRREHEVLLIKKMHEEFGELIEAIDSGDYHWIRSESGDLAEVVMAYLQLRTGTYPDQLLEIIAKKQHDRGGFLGGLVWEHP